MKTTLIAIPCMDQVPAQFCQSLASLEKTGPSIVAFQVGSLVYSSRNNLAIEAVRRGADYVFWLDSDMVFPPAVLKRLLEVMEQQKDDVILSGVYFRRVAPFSPVAYEKLDIDENGSATWTELSDVPGEPFEIAACGFGCVLMPTNALIDVQTKFGTMFNPINGTGEDLSFCWRARQCGWKFMCDPTVELGHVGHHVITKDYWRDYKEFTAQEAANEQ